MRIRPILALFAFAPFGLADTVVLMIAGLPVDLRRLAAAVADQASGS